MILIIPSPILSNNLILYNVQDETKNVILYEATVIGKYITENQEIKALKLDDTQLPFRCKKINIQGDLRHKYWKDRICLLLYHKGKLGIPWVEVVGYKNITSDGKEEWHYYNDGDWIIKSEP